MITEECDYCGRVKGGNDDHSHAEEIIEEEYNAGVDET